jgi:class I fructose-bisphosphate aldolase
MPSKKILDLLGDKASFLLDHKPVIDKSVLGASPSPNHVEEIWVHSDRNSQVLRSIQTLLGHGRLANTGYLSILPVDQGIEHSAGASFADNPMYFDPENIIRLAIEADCNAVATTLAVHAIMSRKYAHRIPFLVKINHNELLTMPNHYQQTMFGTVKGAWNTGAVAVGATVYWGSEDSDRELKEVADAFELAHELGLATVLWCYTRNAGFVVNGVDYHTSADLTGQANYLGVSLRADIIKQKLPTNNGGYLATRSGKTSPLVYSKLMHPDNHPIDLTRYQVLNCFSGRVGLINSGGESHGTSDWADAVFTAVVNKRAGGMGVIMGRKSFQRPFKEGVEMIQLVQDVYLDKDITIA